jgi:sulfide:quinone oxidoreductase
MKRVLVLGAGFGGLELSTSLSEAFGNDIEVVLIDQSDHFVFGFSKLDVMFGRTAPDTVRHYYRDFVKPGVRFIQTTIRSIDPTTRAVETDAGHLDADVMVVALGADLDIAATPGLVEVGHEFYTVAGAFALRDVLANFSGGHVVVGVTSTPFKCPPAPSETALMMHDFLVERGLRGQSRISLVSPLPMPIPPSPAASEALLAAFAERGIGWFPGQVIRELDPVTKTARFADGTDLPFDLFLGIPTHRVPRVVAESGMTVDGWIPVNPLTLETSFPNVFAVGDVTSVGTPKAGVFSERQASIAAQHIIALLRGNSSSAAYDGFGLCYLEFGHDQVARVEVTFMSGQSPQGTYAAPSVAISAEKGAYGASRIRRWFDQAWTNVPEKD